MPRRFVHDLFHLFMTVSWPIIFASFAAFFFMFNLLFAAAYSLQPDDIANLNPAGYRGRFFFSVETFETVGYGDMHPQTPFAHIVDRRFRLHPKLFTPPPKCPASTSYNTIDPCLA